MRTRRDVTAVLFVAFAFAAAADGALGERALPTINWNDKAVRRQAVLETAYAYYLKADCVQYGSVPLVESALYKDVGWLAYSRRTKEGTPEDATPDSTYFTVCSSFTYETYFNAMGFRQTIEERFTNLEHELDRSMGSLRTLQIPGQSEPADYLEE